MLLLMLYGTLEGKNPPQIITEEALVIDTSSHIGGRNSCRGVAEKGSMRHRAAMLAK